MSSANCLVVAEEVEKWTQFKNWGLWTIAVYKSIQLMLASVIPLGFPLCKLE